jgi:glycosyltransferase involved in cell wall biosynthesis
METYYAFSSVFISASKMETYGMAVQEALAYGLPVLAYAGGYVRIHIRPGVNGYLCSTFSELARLCVKFIQDSKELEYLRDRTEKSRSGINHTWDKAAEMFVRQTSRLIPILFPFDRRRILCPK